MRGSLDSLECLANYEAVLGFLRAFIDCVPRMMCS